MEGLSIEIIPTNEAAFTNKADKAVADAPKRFEALGAAIAESANRFWAAMNEKVVNKPTEIEIQLHVGLEVGGNWLVVSGKTSATASIKLAWK